MKITSESYDSVCTVNHQGYVLSFVTRRHVDGDEQADYDDILYNVLDVASVGKAEAGRESATSSDSDPSAAWSPYVLLEFPSEVAPAAMRVLAAPVPGVNGSGQPNTSAIATRPDAPIRVVSVGGQIFVFRQIKTHANDTLYIDRFSLDVGRLCLVPVRESRFSRSQLADVPASNQDSLAVRTPSGELFVAATIVLSLDGPISDGFAVALVPSSEDSSTSYWHLFVCRDGEVFVYRVRNSAYAPFDLRAAAGDEAPTTLDPTDDSCHRITPITSWSVAGYALSQPATAVYAQQEEFVDPNGDAVSLLKGGRVLLAAVARTSSSADTGVVAVVDFAIAANGQIAVLDQQLPSLPSLPFAVALSFDGRNDSVRSNAWYGGYMRWYAEVWVRWPGGDEDGTTRCVLATEDQLGTNDVAVSLDSDGKLVVQGRDPQGQLTTWRTVRCVPRRRWTRIGVLADEGYPPLCYVNSGPVAFEAGELTQLVKPQNFQLVLGKWRGQGQASAQPFLGELSDLRLYSASQSNIERDDLLDPDAVLHDNNMIMHWPLAEGTGSTTSGIGQANITGAQWTPAGPPSQRSMQVLARDGRLLDVRGGLLATVETAAAPSLLVASDGRLHLYYQRSDNEIGVAHLSTEVARAQEVLYWTRDGGEANSLDVALVLTARLPGVDMNNSPASEFGPVSTDGLTFTTVELYSELSGCAGISAVKEVWRDVPRELVAFCKILDGEAVQPDAEGVQVEQAHGQVVYDYAGKVTLSSKSGDQAWGPEQAPTVEPGASYASFLFHASGLDASKSSDPATIPAERCLRFRISGGDSCWLMNPIQPLLYLSDGSDVIRGHVSVPAADQLSIPGDLTLEVWMSQQRPATSSLMVYVDERTAYQLGFDGQLRPYAIRGGQDGGPTLLQRASVPLASGWQHVAAVYSTSYGLQLRDGVHVDCGGGKDMEIREALCVEAWVRPDVLPSSGEEQVLVSRWDETRLDRGFKLSFTNTQVRFDVGIDGSTGSILSNEMTHSLAAGRWAHVAGVYVGSQPRNMLELSPADENYLDVGPLTAAVLSCCTVEMWLAPAAWTGDERVLFEASYTSSSASVTALRLEYDKNYGSSSGTGLRVVVNDNHAMQVALPSWSASDPGYHHLAVSMALVAGKLSVTVYFDGAAIRVGSSTALFPEDARSDRWVFGASLVSGTAQDFYAGAMHDVRVWNVARTSGEIIDGMTRRLEGDEDGLIGYWPLSHAAGSGASVTNLADNTHQVVHRREPAQAGDSSGKVSWVRRETGCVFSLWIDGALQVGPSVSAAPVKTDAPLLIGAAASGAGLTTLLGAVDDVRIWRSQRWPAQIEYFTGHALIDADRDGRLAAAWTMDEGRGTVLADSKAGSPGTITGMSFTPTSGTDGLWIPTSFGGTWKLYVDGEAVALELLELPSEDEIDLRGLQERAFGMTLGSPQLDQQLASVDGDPLKFKGYLVEARVWASSRSATAIAEDYDRPLRGDEPTLVGYWPLRDGSGSAIVDRSPYHGDGQLILESPTASPGDVWMHSDPPTLAQEDPRVVDASNNHAWPAARAVHLLAPPSVAEYYAAGRARRAYVYIVAQDTDGSATELSAGRSVGALELAYLGQIQYDAQLVGYIEGAPPVPSENLTIDSPTNPDRYVGTAIVSLDNERVDDKESSFGWELGGGLRGEIDGGGAVSGGAEVSDSVFAGVAEGFLALYLIEGDLAGADADVFNAEGKLAIHAEGQIEGGGGSESTTSTQVERSSKDSVVLAGGWENNVYNIPWASAEQRFIQATRFYRPNNMAAALVRSKTADLFAVRSKETGAVLGYKLEPADGVKRDTNVIMFKLNPRYVKNGTLDGNIGYDRDLDWSEPSAEASYLRPAEAYRMQANAERQQVDGKDASELDFANTYVWTADGGLHQQEVQLGAQRKDVYSGALTISGSIGLRGRLEIETGLALNLGIEGGFDVAADLKLNLKWQDTDTSSSRIALSSVANGEGFLNKLADTRSVPITTDASSYSGWVSALGRGQLSSSLAEALAEQTGVQPTARVMITVVDPGSEWMLVDVLVRYRITGDVTPSTLTFTPPQQADPGQYPVLYGSSLCPGKVRDYRFSTIYQHPRSANFDLLFGDAAGQDEPIIDPDWLASSDPDAVALRQARAHRKAVWRVLHRVTYVNRVPLDDSAKTEPDPPPSGSTAPEQVSNRELRPDDYSMVANARTIAAGLYGIDVRMPDYAQMSVNVDNLLATLGLGTTELQRRYYHDLVMLYLEALLAAGTLPAAV
jgi:hypothetical protein